MVVVDDVQQRCTDLVTPLVPTRVWPCQVERAPSSCGHTIPKVCVPVGGGWWRDVLVWEPEEQPRNPLERYG